MGLVCHLAFLGTHLSEVVGETLPGNLNGSCVRGSVAGDPKCVLPGSGSWRALGVGGDEY